MQAGPLTSLLAQRGQYNMSFRPPPRTLEHLGQLFRVFMDLWNPLTSTCFNINWPKPSTALTPNQPYLKPENPSRSIILKSHSVTSFQRKQHRNHNKVQSPAKKNRGFVTLLFPYLVPFWEFQRQLVEKSKSSCCFFKSFMQIGIKIRKL